MKKNGRAFIANNRLTSSGDVFSTDERVSDVITVPPAKSILYLSLGSNWLNRGRGVAEAAGFRVRGP
jgi:hypothetical protein